VRSVPEHLGGRGAVEENGPEIEERLLGILKEKEKTKKMK